MTVSDKIREHLAEYPLNHRFTVEQVRLELRLPTMQGKHYLFTSLVDKGMIKQVRMKKKNSARYWIYEKIINFTAQDTKPKRKSMDSPLIPHKEFDQFIFGGCGARIADNLHHKTNGRVFR